MSFRKIDISYLYRDGKKTVRACNAALAYSCVAAKDIRQPNLHSIMTVSNKIFQVHLQTTQARLVPFDDDPATSGNRMMIAFSVERDKIQTKVNSSTHNMLRAMVLGIMA